MAANGVHERNANVLEEAVEQLSEKRSSTREQGFATLNSEFKTTYSRDFIDKQIATLTEAISKAVKKGGPKEQTLSATTLSLICVTLGLESENLFKETSPSLVEIINHSSDEEVRIACLEALSLCCFVDSDEATTIETMKLLSSIFSQDNVPVLIKAAALSGWNLLLTSISKRYIYDVLIPDHLAYIVGLLSNDNVDLRVECGEAVALLLEIVRDVEDENFELENLNGYIDTDELLDQLYALAQDKSKTRSRKDKIKQRLPFKEIKNYVENGETPVEELEIKFTKLSFSTWAQIKQLDSIRELLGVGFAVHFESNELLQDMFDIHISSNATRMHLTAIEKRKLMSPNSELSKSRTKNLHKQRQQRENSTASALLYQDD